MRKPTLFLAALLLFPVAAAADELSVALSGDGQGFASLETEGTSITWGIVTDGIGTIQDAFIRRGGTVVVDLDVAGGNVVSGSAFGTTDASAADVDEIEDDPEALNLFVAGTTGNLQGTLALAQAGGGGPGGSAGTLAFTQTTFNVAETGGTTITVNVSRTGGTNGAVAVDFATANGTATAGADYTAASGTLAWANGEGGNKSFNVTVLDDTVLDPGESFTIALSGPTGGATLGAATATVAIADDEGIPADCVPDETTLCLGENDRFHAVMTFRAPGGQTTDARTVHLDTVESSGIFYFFGPNNAEVLLKVLDGCDVPGSDHYWVFFAATTNVEYTLTVTDTQARLQKTYTNDQGVPAAPVQDTRAFATCP